MNRYLTVRSEPAKKSSVQKKSGRHNAEDENSKSKIIWFSATRSLPAECERKNVEDEKSKSKILWVSATQILPVECGI